MNESVGELTHHKEAARFADRMARIAPFYVMEVLRRATELEREGRDIVHMEIGQPDFAAPQPVIEAAQRAMRGQPLGYTPALGLPELREAIAAHYQSSYGVSISPARIAVTTGSSAALLMALAALVGPSDEVLLPDPCYPCSLNLVLLAGATARRMPVFATTGHQPSAADVDAHVSARTRALLLASPSNPSGALISVESMRALIASARGHGLVTLVDEIYGGLVFDESPRTVLSLSNEVVVVSGFSKYFCMPGWRLGWMVAPEGLLQEIEKLAQNAYVSPPAVAQYAALAAFQPDSLEILEERRGQFRARRDFLFSALREIGFTLDRLPDGAFYLYAGCEAFSGDSAGFATHLLETGGVACAPGIDFGEHEASRRVRFAYTRSFDDLQKGVERLRRFCRAS
jgi:aspartate/methionine/tyrosine aminotransferase